MATADFNRGLKECLGCGEQKEVFAFNRDRRSPDGLYPRCRDCMRPPEQAKADRRLESQRAKERARNALQKTTQQVLGKALKSQDAPHIEAVLEHVVYAFGGVQRFSQEWVQQIRQMKDGSAGRTRAYEQIARLMIECRKGLDPESEELMSDEALESRIVAIIGGDIIDAQLVSDTKQIDRE